jgi:hypothetical protein
MPGNEEERGRISRPSPLLEGTREGKLLGVLRLHLMRIGGTGLGDQYVAPMSEMAYLLVTLSVPLA